MIRRTILRAATNDTPRPAVFLDRDGTLNEYCGFVTEPSQIKLCDGAASALRILRQAGYCCVLVTNQSAIGRGMLTEAGLTKIHDELQRQLEIGGAQLDAIYWYPDLPTVNDETTIENPDRKPGPGMLLSAANDLNLDLSQSWMIGDRLSDMLASQHAGCCGCVRIRSSCEESGHWPYEQRQFEEATSLMHAVTVILSLIEEERFLQPQLPVSKPATPNGDHSTPKACSRMDENPILEHFESPWHRGRLLDATHEQYVRNPVCGDEVTLMLRVINGRIDSAWFTAGGCIVSQAAASILCEHIEGQSFADLVGFQAENMLKLIGVQLTARRQQCGLLAFKALKSMVYTHDTSDPTAFNKSD